MAKYTHILTFLWAGLGIFLVVSSVIYESKSELYMALAALGMSYGNVVLTRRARRQDAWLASQPQRECCELGSPSPSPLNDA
ncbi:MAG: hypothetical protein VYA34_02265 [Myxococcota bacterium]|nr:hypothetical protein [Myxococcota bacterium]